MTTATPAESTASPAYLDLAAQPDWMNNFAGPFRSDISLTGTYRGLGINRDAITDYPLLEGGKVVYFPAGKSHVYKISINGIMRMSKEEADASATTVK